LPTAAVAFDTLFIAAGIEVLRTPPQAPRADAFGERWVGTARRECTHRRRQPRVFIAGAVRSDDDLSVGEHEAADLEFLDRL
jgi:hypothetical protein